MVLAKLFMSQELRQIAEERRRESAEWRKWMAEEKEKWIAEGEMRERERSKNTLIERELSAIRKDLQQIKKGQATHDTSDSD